MTKTILTAAVAALVAILAGIHAGLIVAAILAFYFLSLEIDRQIKMAKTRI